MFGLGVLELICLLVIIMFVFGWGRLPQLGSNFRQAIRNFKLTARGKDEVDVTPIATDKTERKESRHAQ